MRKEDIIKLNANAYSTQKIAIKEAWDYVKETGERLEIDDIPESLLDEVLEESGVDLGTSLIEEDMESLSYRTDYIRFFLDKENGYLIIVNERNETD